jgi:propionate CoA-transferase
MAKIVSVEQAVSHIKDNDILAVNGMMWVGGCRMFYPALEERFLRTGSPRNLSLFSSCGLGHTMASGTEPELANCLAHPGLVKKIVTSHVQSFVDFLPMIQNNEIEAYIISQGTVAAMLHSAARRVPRTMTRVGLQTFLDPRHRGGALNDISRDKIVDVGEIDGEEYLFYKTIYPNACLIRGTTADAAGNITCEHEPSSTTLWPLPRRSRTTAAL